MDNQAQDSNEAAWVRISMNENMSMLIDRVCEMYWCTYPEAATLALGLGLAAMESEWGRAMIEKLRSQGPH